MSTQKAFSDYSTMPNLQLHRIFLAAPTRSSREGEFLPERGLSIVFNTIGLIIQIRNPWLRFPPDHR